MGLDKKFIRAGIVTAGLGLLATPLLANHSWGNYHWATASGVVEVPVIDNTTGVWQTSSPFGTGNYVRVAVDDWNKSENINSSLSSGNADSSCPLVVGEIHVCNGDYGDTGWVGIASISTYRGRDSHIAGGITKLNDYFFDTYTAANGTKPYDNPTWRQLVTCQEIGHDYGLGHQNENFSTDATTSCMEYTSKPADNEHPDAHDYEQLAEIYAHDGGGTDPSPGPGKGGGKGGKNKVTVGNTPAAWGQAIGYDAQGRANMFKRSTNSFDIYTHVTWAPHVEGGNGHDHEAEPRRHSGERVFNF